MLHEKYRPREIEEIAHVPCRKVLREFDAETFPSIILTGQEGSGKRTLLRAFMKRVFGSESCYKGYTAEIELGSSKTVEVELMENNESVEIKVSGYGQSDKKILQKIAKDISETKSIKSWIGAGQKRAKVLVISDGESLSQGAQMALRRIMEKGADNFRVVVMTTSTSTFIDAFKSRFLICRVPAMSDEEVAKRLEHVCAEEKKAVQPHLIAKIAKESKGNLNKALSILEMAMATEAPEIRMEWEEVLSEISAAICASPSINELVESRKKVYSALDSLVPGSEILLRLIQEVLEKETSVETAKSIAQYGSLFSARLSTGTRDLFHIEAFIARAMSLRSNSK